MVDRKSRDRYASLLEELVAGRITNEEYEEGFDHILKSAAPRDGALEAVYGAAWGLYDDVREYRLVGKDAPTELGYREVARWVLFLRSELEYEWPMNRLLRSVGCVLNLLTLGLIGLLFRPVIEWHRSRLGTLHLWPFIREEDYRRECERRGGG